MVVENELTHARFLIARMPMLSPEVAFQPATDALATRRRAGRPRAGDRLVATVERGISVLSRQSPADGPGRLASHGRRRRATGGLLPDLSQAERARSRSRTDWRDHARQLARVP